MTTVVVPVVVDGVKQSVTLDFGGATAGLVDVVVLEGYFVVRAVEVKSPVLMTIAGGAVIAGAIDV